MGLFFLFMTFSCSSTSVEENPAPEDKTAAQAATAESDPNISVNVSVGLVSGRILFQNRSSETLKNILVVLNQSEQGGFRHTISIVRPYAMLHYTPRVFTRADGARLDPSIHKVDNITVYADTAAGRGRWYGSYSSQ